jgi:hypothetical protein
VTAAEPLGRQLAVRYLRALERFDVDEVVSCFTADARYSPPAFPWDPDGSRQVAVGHTGLVALLEARGSQRVRHEITAYAEDGSTCFVAGRFWHGDVAEPGTFVSVAVVDVDARRFARYVIHAIPPREAPPTP